MESKYQVTYNKSKYGWFANISYSYSSGTSTRRFHTYKTGCHTSLEKLSEDVTQELIALEKKNG